jgi:hypothetical protein
LVSDTDLKDLIPRCRGALWSTIAHLILHWNFRGIQACCSAAFTCFWNDIY